jgi:hypothetical protein
MRTDVRDGNIAETLAREMIPVKSRPRSAISVPDLRDLGVVVALMRLEDRFVPTTGPRSGGRDGEIARRGWGEIARREDGEIAGR